MSKQTIIVLLPGEDPMTESFRHLSHKRLQKLVEGPFVVQVLSKNVALVFSYPEDEHDELSPNRVVTSAAGTHEVAGVALICGFDGRDQFYGLTKSQRDHWLAVAAEWEDISEGEDDSLPEGWAGIMLGPDGEVDPVLPALEEGELLPHVELALAICTKLSADDGFGPELIKWLHEQEEGS